MNRMMRIGAGIVASAMACSAMAQPTITSLGSGVPLGVTNNNGGTIYIGGSGVNTTAPARWTLSGSVMSFSELTGVGGGYISVDNGTYIATNVLNNPRFASGNTATGVSPAFTPNPALTVSSANPAATEFGGARVNASTNTLTNLGVLPIIPFTANPDRATISTITCGAGVATVTTTTAHNLAVNDVAYIYGNSTAAYNGAYLVTNVIDALNFQYAVTCGVNGTGGTLKSVDIGNSGVYGSGSSSGSTGNFVAPNAISPNGRFIVGQAYVSCYNTGATAGTSISANTFYWRPMLWDAQANAGAGAMSVLPTPFKTSTSAGVNTRRRSGNAYAVSNDGLVIAGATEHNIGTTPTADADGGRYCVWRWNSGTSSYDMVYLDTGVDANGFPGYVSSTPSNLAMNAAGTIIVARGPNGITKWTWNGTTWGAPTVIGANLTTPASWLPFAVTSCGVPPTLGGSLAMSDDGNTIVGSAVYSTCGSFMSGGFIWHNSDGLIQDWYDYLVSLGTPGITANYGPIGDNGDPSKGLPKLGHPTAISPDGNQVVGAQLGTQRIPGAPPWILQFTGGPTCVQPVITSNPAASRTLSLCSFGTTSNSIILTAGAAGTLPIGYQWRKNSNNMTDGPTGTGSNVTGSTTNQVRVNAPIGPADVGNYDCVVSGCNASTATTTASVVTLDPAVTGPANDTCASAIATTAPVSGVSTSNFNICGAYINDGGSTCLGVGQVEVADVWYIYTPAFTGNARFQTCGSTFDTTLQIIDNCTNRTVLACNNDVGARGLVGLGSACGSNRAVIDQYPVTIGVPVYVRVGAIGTPTSNAATTGVLTISQAPAVPANDHCAGATVVGLGTFGFNLAEATDDFTFGTEFCSSPVDTQTASNRDVFFLLNSPCGGTYSVTTCGLASPNITNPMLHIMEPDCTGLVIACDDNTTGCSVGGSSQAQILNFTISGPVLIRVSQSGTGSPGTNALSGTGQIVITGTPTPCTGSCCCGSNCSITDQATCTGAGRVFTLAGVCTPFSNTAPCCRGDYNKANGISVQDIFDFLSGYFSVDPCANTNDSPASLAVPNGISVQDIFDFLSAYFGGGC